MRNDDYLDKTPAGRPRTYMAQATMRLAMSQVEDIGLMNRIFQTEQRSSLDVETLEMRDGVILFNENYVVKTVARRAEDVSKLSDEIHQLFK